MNRDAMMVALGVGIGALICTEQGRGIINTITKTPIMQAIGESALNMFKANGEGQTTSEAPAAPQGA